MKTRNPLIKENKFFKYVKIYCAELLPLKNTREKVNLKSPQTKIPCLLKFLQPLFVVRAMIMRVEIKYVENDSKHPESVSKQPAGYYHFVFKYVFSNLLQV